MRLRVKAPIVIVVVGVVAITAASVVSMYPSLDDARAAVDERWGTAQTELARRYQGLAALSRAVRAVRGDFEILDEVDDGLADWEALTGTRPTPDADEESAAANRVEGLGARLARAVTARPSLRQSPDVVQALRDYLAADVTGVLEGFNDAVERYDRARSRFPGRFFASIIGFDTLATVEVPAGLADLDVPDVPPATATATTTAGAG